MNYNFRFRLHPWFLVFVALFLVNTAHAQNLGGIGSPPIWHLRGDDITGQGDNAPVSSWAANVGPTPTQDNTGKFPVYKTGGPNAKPFVSFSGTQGLYTAALSSSAGSYSIFSVQRIPDTTTNHWLFDSQTGRFVAFLWHTASSGWFDGGFKYVNNTSASLQPGSWVIYEFRLDSTGNSGTLYVNGTAVGNTVFASRNVGGTTAIGNAYDTATGNGPDCSAGDVAEFALYAGVLSTADRNAVGGTLASKYGLTTAYTGAGLTSGAITANATTTTSITPQLGTITGGTAPYSTVFSYATSTNGTYTQIGTAVADANPIANAAASGLSPNTTYYFRAVVTDSTGGTPLTITVPSTTTGTPLTTAAAGVTVAANNAAWVDSPYNWLVSAGGAKTICAGAYRRILFTGATCQVNLTIGSGTPYSQLWARIDGGSWQQYTPSASGAQSWTLTLPTPNTATTRLLEILVKSTTEGQDRWTAQTTAVTITGLTLSAGGTVSAPARRKYTIFIPGDSITEGVRTQGLTGIALDTDRNDALNTYSYRIGELLNAEVGVVGYGGTGFQKSGSGNVPALATSYNLLWAGQARSFAIVPDLVIYNLGANENGSAILSQVTSIVNGIGYTGTGNTNAGLNGTRHLILRPFGGQNEANLIAAVNSFAHPNIVYGNTFTFWSSSEAEDGLHPYGWAHVANLAPKVSQLALSLLRNATATGGTKRRTQ